MLSRLAPLRDCGLLVPSVVPCAEAALPGGETMMTTRPAQVEGSWEAASEKMARE